MGAWLHQFSLDKLVPDCYWIEPFNKYNSMFFVAPKNEFYRILRLLRTGPIVTVGASSFV